MSEQDTDTERAAAGRAFAAQLFEGYQSSGPGMIAPLADDTMSRVFGDLWQRPELSHQQRSLITCAFLIALNREAEMRAHFTGARNLGIKRSEMEGMIVHAAYYAGWPSAVTASRVLQEVWPEDVG